MLILVAVAFRIWDWPARYDVRNIDEPGYLYGSLALVEGITPGYKPSPAGPQVWLGWAGAEIETAWSVVHPTPQLRSVSLAVRPFVAMNHALFSLYHDLSGLRQMIITIDVALLLAAVAAGFVYGLEKGGIPAGIVCGGMVGLSPIFIDFSLMARPYTMGWSFALMSIAAIAVMRGRWRIVLSGILLGLAIGSRIEMLVLTPLLLWELWERPVADKSLLKAWAKLVGIAVLTAYVVAPWLITGLPGNLRAIATIQMVNPTATDAARHSAMLNYAWTNGFGFAALAFVLTIPLIVKSGNGLRRLVLVVLMAVLICTLFKTTGFGLHQSGEALVATVLASAWAIAEIQRRWPGGALFAALAVLLLPFGQSIRAIGAQYHGTAATSADWLASHIPPGTVIYTQPALLKAPLPTVHAADLIWDDVTNSQAWKRKIGSGLARFGLTVDQLPRAMSEENLVQERGNARRWFILGSETQENQPRYELRLIQSSPVFGVQDVSAAFAASGGVVLWPGLDAPAGLGEPAAVLHHMDGMDDVTVFCSPELRSAVTSR